MSVRIELATDSEAEERTRAALVRLLDRHDLGPWTFTTEVRIDERARPHSHPVLTLSTEHADDALQLLAGYVHEQLHWYEEAYAEARDRAIEATRGPYPVVPVERPEGCGDEESTRLHLLVCCLELEALKQLVGEPAALEAVRQLSLHHYRWVYHRVLTDEQRLLSIMRDAGLYPVRSAT